VTELPDGPAAASWPLSRGGPDGPDAFRTLLSPIQIGPRTVRNRVVSTAHGGWNDFRSPADDGSRYIAYQERRARGGTGLIILQSLIVEPARALEGPYALDFARDRHARMAQALHRHGATAVVQIVHNGSYFGSAQRPGLAPGISLSGMPTPGGEGTRVLSPEEIEELINGFVACALIAVESGLDGVELHAAHGYLLQQSFSPWGNSRTDQWSCGTALVKEVAQRVRSVIGEDRILGIRMCADDLRPREEGGLGPAELRSIAADVIGTGLFDYLNHSEGSTHEHYALAVGTWRRPRAEWAHLTAGLKAAIGSRVPVIGVGRIKDVATAERLLREGTCDLVGMTRAQISDPDLVSKVSSGRAAAIRPCVGANQGCQDWIAVGQRLTCFHNPTVGFERSPGALAGAAFAATSHTVRTGRSLIVIGGGPAGLKAAEVAATLGFGVTLLEREPEVGGRLRLASHTVAAELAESVDWHGNRLAELGVDVHCSVEADIGLLHTLRTDAIVVATGAEPARSWSPYTDAWSGRILTVDEAVAGDAVAGSVLVVDLAGSVEVVLAAEQLARRGSLVTVVCAGPVIGANQGKTHVYQTPEVLLEAGCELEPNTSVTSMQGDTVTTVDRFHGTAVTRRFDAVVIGGLARPRRELAAKVARQIPEVPAEVIGDACAARGAMFAYRDGQAAAYRLAAVVAQREEIGEH
jgi:2,4-dienoyl-CoA reductase-like NADH-dependent reductase (Old Yellow Enzyme family)